MSFLNQIISYLNDDSYNMLTGYDVNVILLKGFHGFFFFFFNRGFKIRPFDPTF